MRGQVRGNEVPCSRCDCEALDPQVWFKLGGMVVDGLGYLMAVSACSSSAP